MRSSEFDATSFTARAAALIPAPTGAPAAAAFRTLGSAAGAFTRTAPATTRGLGGAFAALVALAGGLLLDPVQPGVQPLHHVQDARELGIRRAGLRLAALGVGPAGTLPALRTVVVRGRVRTTLGAALAGARPGAPTTPAGPAPALGGILRAGVGPDAAELDALAALLALGAFRVDLEAAFDHLTLTALTARPLHAELEHAGLAAEAGAALRAALGSGVTAARAAASIGEGHHAVGAARPAAEAAAELTTELPTKLAAPGPVVLTHAGPAPAGLRAAELLRPAALMEPFGDPLAEVLTEVLAEALAELLAELAALGPAGAALALHARAPLGPVARAHHARGALVVLVEGDLELHGLLAGPELAEFSGLGAPRGVGLGEAGVHDEREGRGKQGGHEHDAISWPAMH